MKRKVYLFGSPGKVGGAATKIWDLLTLLREDFDLCLVLRHKRLLKDREIQEAVRESGVRVELESKLPKRMEGVALVICELDIFESGRAERLKERGLKLYFSNEMMWKFQGEEEAVQQGLVDKVFFLSEYQAEAFRELYKGVPEAVIDNYVEPSRFLFAARRNAGIVLGRLSRPDPVKFSEDFPVFYEALELPEARYRVMAWSRPLHEKYAWHRFGSEWELLGAGAVAAADFLRSLDLFVYSFGPFFRESWGRAVVEAMLTGAIPLVPADCHFGHLVGEGESGYLCGSFAAYQEAAQQLYWDCDLRRRMSERCARYAREKLCDRAEHRVMWAKALSE